MISERERRFEKSEVLSVFTNDFSVSRNSGEKIEKGEEQMFLLGVGGGHHACKHI